MHPHLPLTVIASLDPVLRDLATASAVCDVPGTVVLRYDLGPGSEDGLRRVVSDLSGVLEDVSQNDLEGDQTLCTTDYPNSVAYAVTETDPAEKGTGFCLESI